ncbi:hypothetical protein AT6N2_C3366 [Agrobacterium tumefaciens]|nr:hypothetical protein AT6N2_C3366 [Agrobacterium tumefaciens]
MRPVRISLLGCDDLAVLPLEQREGLRGQVAAFTIGDLADGGRESFAALQNLGDRFGILGVARLFDTGLEDFDGSVCIEREGFRRNVGGLQGFCGALGIIVLQGVGGVGEDRAFAGLRTNVPEFAVRQAVTADNGSLGTDILELARQKTRFRVVTAKIDDIDIFRLQTSRQCAEILFTGCQGIIENLGDTAGIQRCFKGIRQTLAIGALVMNDRDLLVLEIGENVFRCNLGLLVVTTAGAEDIRQAAVGQARRSCRRRHHQHTVFGKDVRRRNGDARCYRTNDEMDPFGNQLVGCGNALLRLAAIIGKLQHDLFAEDAALFVDFIDCRLGAILDLVAIGSDGAGERRNQADDDLGMGKGCECEGRGERHAGQCLQFHPGVSLEMGASPR